MTPQALANQPRLVPPVLPVLTEKQADALRYVFEVFEGTRDYPTLRDLGLRLDVTRKRAAEIIESLVKKGYLIKIPERHRANIELTDAAYERLRFFGLDVSTQQTGQLVLFRRPAHG